MAEFREPHAEVTAWPGGSHFLCFLSLVPALASILNHIIGNDVEKDGNQVQEGHVYSSGKKSSS